MSIRKPFSGDVEGSENSQEGEAEIQFDSARRGGIQVDGYKIKANIQPVDIGETKPESWKDVGRAVNAKIQSIAVNLFGLVDDTLIGSRRLIRGLAEIPGAIVSRVDHAHKKVDEAESKRQNQMVEGTLKLPSPESIVDRVEASLLELQAKGVPVTLRKLPDGRMAIVIVRPELQDAAIKLVQQSLPAPSETMPGIEMEGSDVVRYQFHDSRYSLPIAVLGLSLRARNGLSQLGIATIGELVSRSADELLKAKNFGVATLNEVRVKLAKLDLMLSNE